MESDRFENWLQKIYHTQDEEISCTECFDSVSRFVDLDSLAESEKGKRMLSSKEQTPEQKALNSELKSLLENAVQNLPVHYRSVLIMRDVEGLGTAETSECLAISEETVKVRLHRARALMRKQLYAHAGVTRQELFSFQKPRCDRMVAAVFKSIYDLRLSIVE